MVKIKKAGNKEEDFVMEDSNTSTFFSRIESTGKGFWKLYDKNGNEKTIVRSLENFDKGEVYKFRAIQFVGGF